MGSCCPIGSSTPTWRICSSSPPLTSCSRSHSAMVSLRTSSTLSNSVVPSHPRKIPQGFDLSTAISILIPPGACRLLAGDAQATVGPGDIPSPCACRGWGTEEAWCSQLPLTYGGLGAFWSLLSTSGTGQERSVTKMDNMGWTCGWASHLCWDAYKRWEQHAFLNRLRTGW